MEKSALKIEVNNNFSYIYGNVPFEIIEECTLSQTYFYRDRSHNLKIKEQRKCYFNKSNNSFPTGWLYSKVIKTLKNLGITYEIIDKREMPSFEDRLNSKFSFEPFPYQQRAIDLVTKEKHYRGIISIGTGGGKTFIAAKIIAHFGLQTLYIVPSLLLLNQTYKGFLEWFGNKNVGYVGGGAFKPALITIATAQTLWARRTSPEIEKLLHNAQILILDEAHHIQKPNFKSGNPGNTWYILSLRTPNAVIRLGLTATPGKEGEYSRQLLEAITGKIIFECSLSWLMENNYLSKLKVFIYKIKINTPYSEWEESYSENILKNNERNSKIIEIAKKLADSGKRVLIIVNRIEEHGKILTDMLKDNAESLYGLDSAKERKEVLDRFSSRKTKIVVSTIIREGVDLPEMDAIIIASGGRGGDFGRDLIQKLGRVVRLSDNKSSAILVDFYDDDGYAEYIDILGKKKRKPNLMLRHSLQRLNIYKREPQFEINLM